MGGEYPLSAAITSESSSDNDKVTNLAKVFSMQGFGTLLCAIVLVTLSYSLGKLLYSIAILIIRSVPGSDYDPMWRLALAIGGTIPNDFCELHLHLQVSQW